MEYRIPVIFAQGGQDTMSGHYPANVTNYRPGRNNLTCEGGQLSCRNFEIGFNNTKLIRSIVPLMILTILLSTIFKVPSAEFRVMPNQSNSWVGSHTDLSSLTTIGVRAIFCRGGGKPFAQKIFASCPNFYKTVEQKRGPMQQDRPHWHMKMAPYSFP